MNKIAVIDYGSGNLRNVCKALEHVGGDVVLSDRRDVIARADKIVLPGVGAFADCRQGLIDRGLFDSARAWALSGRPFLGICVGMQLLFDVGEELGRWPGLGVLPGRVVRFDFGALPGGAALKIPHIGWNRVRPCQPGHPLLQGVQPDGYAYFVHSYHAHDMDPRHVITMTDYGYDFPSAVAKDNIWGIQFHPEKSQDVGLQMLRNFLAV